jgi:phage host-nuclease inhibitor protein Gam
MINELIEMELNEIEDILERTEDMEKLTDERFKIKDIDSANWAFRKLRAIEVKASEIKELAQQEKARIEEWEKQELGSLEHSKEFFEGLLTKYFVIEKSKDPKFKLSTPHGKVTSRKQQPKWSYEEEKTIESLKKHKLKDFIRVKEEVNKADLKKEAKVLKNVVSLNDVICEDVERHGDVLFINKETGEIDDTGEHKFHESVVVCEGKIIEGVTVEERPDFISIKVVE